MYSHEAANIFTDHVGVERGSVINHDAMKMIMAEAESEVARGAFYGQRNQAGKGVEVALERLIDWYDHGDEYNIEPIYYFVASHRVACVWAVLLKQNK